MAKELERTNKFLKKFLDSMTEEEKSFHYHCEEYSNGYRDYGEAKKAFIAGYQRGKART